MSVFSLRLPNSLQDDVKLAAQDDGISINQFIMLYQKVRALQKSIVCRGDACHHSVFSDGNYLCKRSNF